jgi:hypothetical protein
MMNFDMFGLNQRTVSMTCQVCGEFRAPCCRMAIVEANRGLGCLAAGLVRIRRIARD